MPEESRTGSSSDVSKCRELTRWMGSRLSHAGLSLYAFPDTGRGLRAEVDVPSGSVLVSVSGCYFESRTLTLSQSSLPVFLREYPLEGLVAFLMVERSLGASSSVREYVESLPETFSNPLYVTNGQIPENLPADVESLLSKQLVELDNAWKVVRRAFGESGLLPVKAACTRRMFLWAWFAVATRSLYIQPGVPALVPFVDLLNHSPCAKTQTCFDDESNCFRIITEDAYTAGQQVFINYGSHDSAKLAVYYGFVVPRNPMSQVVFSLEAIRHRLSLSEKKLRFLKQYDMVRHVSCGWEGISHGLKILLRLVDYQGEDLWSVFTVEHDVAFSTGVVKAFVALVHHELRVVHDRLLCSTFPPLLFTVVRERGDILRETLSAFSATDPGLTACIPVTESLLPL